MSEIIFDKQQNVNILALKGQFLGGAETDELSDIFKKLIDDEQLYLLIDLKKVKYINSTVIGVFISAHTNFARRGGKIIFCNSNKQLDGIFKITKLDSIFNFQDTLEDAKKSFENN